MNERSDPWWLVLGAWVAAIAAFGLVALGIEKAGRIVIAVVVWAYEWVVT